MRNRNKSNKDWNRINRIRNNWQRSQATAGATAPAFLFAAKTFRNLLPDAIGNHPTYKTSPSVEHAFQINGCTYSVEMGNNEDISPIKRPRLMNLPKRIPQLDGIRGIAVLLVLISHYVFLQISPQSGTRLLGLKQALSLTWSGVDLFFVLSGFLIGGILLDNRKARNFFQIFFIRRSCRILPLYGLLLASYAVFLLTPFSENSWLFRQPSPPLWSYLTFTQNFFMAHNGNFGPHWVGITWSLAVEEQFYLTAPLLLFFVPTLRLLYVLPIVILTIPMLRHFDPGFQTHCLMHYRADSLLAGVWLACLIRSPQYQKTINSRRFIFALFGTLFAGILLLLLQPKVLGTWKYLWLAAFYSCFILIAVMEKDRWIGRILKNPLLVWFGTFSYAIYMFHQLISGLLHTILRGKAPIMQTYEDVLVTLLALAVTLILASLSYRFLEQPILRYGHKFRYFHSSENQGRENSTEPLQSPTTVT